MERPRYFGEVGEIEQIGWAIKTGIKSYGRVSTTRRSAGVIDLCAFAQFEITGKDAGVLLDRLSANKIPTKDGRMTLNHLLTEKGRFETEITIWRIAEDRFFTGSPIARSTPDFTGSHHTPLRRRREDDQPSPIGDAGYVWSCIATHLVRTHRY